jgi:hypothetical protein
MNEHEKFQIEIKKELLQISDKENLLIKINSLIPYIITIFFILFNILIFNISINYTIKNKIFFIVICYFIGILFSIFFYKKIDNFDDYIFNIFPYIKDDDAILLLPGISPSLMFVLDQKIISKNLPIETLIKMSKINRFIIFADKTISKEELDYFINNFKLNTGIKLLYSRRTEIFSNSKHNFIIEYGDRDELIFKKVFF